MKLMSLSFCFTEHHVLIVLTACIIPPRDACTSVVEEAVVVDVYPAPFEPGVKSIQITEVNPLCDNLSEVVSNKRNLVNVTRKIHEISAFRSLEHGYAYCMVMESVAVILFRESFHHIHPVGSGIPMKLHVITGEISQEGQRPWHPVQYHLPHFHGGASQTPTVFPVNAFCYVTHHNRCWERQQQEHQGFVAICSGVGFYTHIR